MTGAVYSIAFHGRGGRPPGKMASEIEVVPRDRAGPTPLRAATLRALGQLGPTVAMAVLVNTGALAADGPVPGLLMALTFAMPLV